MKYARQHATCKPCPPAEAKPPQDGYIAYRLMGSNPPTENDFLPVAIQQPSRGFSTVSQRCMSYALSYFDTEENLKTRHKKLSKTVKQFANKLNIVAKTEFHSKDGVMTPACKSSGHISFHEAKNSDLKSKTTVIGSV